MMCMLLTAINHVRAEVVLHHSSSIPSVIKVYLFGCNSSTLAALDVGHNLLLLLCCPANRESGIVFC